MQQKDKKFIKVWKLFLYYHTNDKFGDNLEATFSKTVEFIIKA